MLKYSYDLHTHTIFSDGDWLPKTVMRKAWSRGLRGVVIADHNVISAYPEAIKAAKKYDLKTKY